MVTTLLLLQLLAAEVTREGPPPASTQSREQVRLRAGVHFAMAGAYSGAAIGFGPGLSAELGATFSDRFSLSGRLTIGTIFIVSVATLGLAFDVALSDRVTVGIASNTAASCRRAPLRR